MARQKRLSLLLHPFRRELYRILCERPGTYLLELVNLLESPLGTLSWHLRILEREGLVKSLKFAGKRLYYPNMLRSKEAEMAYLILQSETAQKIFSYIVNNPGCHQEEIAEGIGVHHDTIRWHVQRMEEIGLVQTKKEDRRKIHFLGPIGNALLKGSLNSISEAYISFLMEKLEDGCLNPEIKEKTPDRVTIRIDCPDKSQDCYITINLKHWQFDFLEDAKELTSLQTPETKSSDI